MHPHFSFERWTSFVTRYSGCRHAGSDSFCYYTARQYGSSFNIISGSCAGCICTIQVLGFFSSAENTHRSQASTRTQRYGTLSICRSCRQSLQLDPEDHTSTLADGYMLGYPILGSVPEVPEKNGFIKFADWGKQYGPIYQCNLAGHNHVWISSDQIAKDLLSKKAAIYSDRPHIPSLIDDNRSSAQYLPLLSRNGKDR